MSRRNKHQIKQTIFILFFMTISFLLKAQSPSSVTYLEKHLVKGNLLFFPSLTYEFRLEKNSSHTLRLEPGISPTPYIDSDKWYIGVFPKLEAQYRYYYNLKKRIEKNKNTGGNSGNFISLIGLYTNNQDIFSDVERIGNTYLVGPAWGFQRSYPSGFNFQLELGLGYTFVSKSNDFILPIIGIEVGWIIFKSK